MKYEGIQIRKAILLWSILLIISLLLGYSIYSAFSNRIYANVFDSMNNNLRFAESAYDVYMSQMKMGMLQASSDPWIKKLILERNESDLGDILKEWGSHRYYVNEWYVTDRDGVVISFIGKEKSLLMLPDGSTRLQTVLAQAIEHRSAVSGTELVMLNGNTNEHTLIQYVIVPVLEKGEHAIGGIITVMNLNKDNNITGKIMDDTGMHSVITAKDRIIASSFDSGLYKYNMGDMLPEDIRKVVLERGTPYIGRLGIYHSRGNDSNPYFSAFRPIKDISGKIIGTQGIIYYNRLAEVTLGQIRDFTIIVVILLIMIFSIIAWAYLKTQWVLQRERRISIRLAAQKRFSDLVRQASSEDEVYDILFNMLKKNSNITQAIVLKKEYNSKRLSIFRSLNNEGLEAIKDRSISGDSCWAVKTGKEFVCNDCDDFCCNGLCNGADSYICLPIILGGIVSGVIHLRSNRKNYFTEEIISDIGVYIDAITPVISNLRLLDSLNDMASIDTLTKVYNRRYLERHIEERIRISKEMDLHFCIIMLDIDFFKRFNDTYGHDAGDYVLIHFADTLKLNVREGDIVSRYGGEEFVVVLSHTSLPGAYKVAEKLRKKVEKMSLAAIDEENPPSITCSLGISCYPIHGNNMDTLIQSADKALYEAKNSGRNRTCIFGGGMDGDAAAE